MSENIIQIPSHDTDTHGFDPGHKTEHAVPFRILLNVFAALFVLTVLTVAVTYVDLGSMNIWIALAIAVLKAALVALYFMHLRWDSPFNAIILISALFFVALFIGIAVLDSREYRVNYEPPPGMPQAEQ